jgi:hypothetical protein
MGHPTHIKKRDSWDILFILNIESWDIPIILKIENWDIPLTECIGYQVIPGYPGHSKVTRRVPIPFNMIISHL